MLDFSSQNGDPKATNPLADRMRPQRFDEVLGQDEIWGMDGPLRKLVISDRFYSLIFWGPPGCGKTSIAQVICHHSGRVLHTLSAVNAGVKDIRRVLDESQTSVFNGGKAHLLFLDEVHRLSKNQQDVLLPALENGSIRFIGATTENPSFEVNAAVNSRSLVFRFKPIENEAMVKLLRGVVKKLTEKKSMPNIADDALICIAQAAAGDARRAINVLDAVIVLAKDLDEISKSALEQYKSSLPLLFDKSGDQHYDTASALIKSIRGSNVDATIYYLARMIEAGEDPNFIARRLVIAAAEDISNASPQALTLATSGAAAVRMVGMPEARIILAQVCTFLATAPKSNRSYVAIEKAIATVRETGALSIPLNLRNGVTQLMKDFGYGSGYIYAHDDEAGAKRMNYLPEKIRHKKFYYPKDCGFEAQIKARMDKK